ncbi:hypothetical protein JR316_0004294 [Psilocybe cubensis]|uniref:Uncharacterized protein n=1 Tax=Psilocybe cubensis TaxID=181762 RepID=A0ACB8H2X1_PSICU|nr:hypothetical protein JR316_0004294 [Psilocybe cubensis]KAH9482199.1 hypothetical protein JR316_0004294 [Psilocybe cubensis]
MCHADRRLPFWEGVMVDRHLALRICNYDLISKGFELPAAATSTNPIRNLYGPTLVLALIFVLTVLALLPGAMEELQSINKSSILLEVDVEKGPPQSDASRLPLPAQSKGGSGITVCYVDVFNMKKADLVDLCRQYKLPVSGTIKVLIERLQEFSGQREQWDRLTTGVARRSHLGFSTHSSTKPTASHKKSVQRREKMFLESTNTENGNPKSLPSILSTAVQPSHQWCQTRRAADLDWARYIVNLYPYRREETRNRLAERDAAQFNQKRLFSSSNDDDVKAGIEIANGHLLKIVNWVEAGTTSPHPTPSPSHQLQPSTSHFSVAATKDLQNSQGHSISASTTTTPTRTVTMASGSITFSSSDVPPPPAVSFASDIPGLNRMWDDTSIYWDGYSVLTIKGTAIPIVYWKEIYTSKGSVEWKPKQWESLKGKFFDWKILVHQWRQGSPEDFWAKFTKDGKILGYRQILDQLAEQRTAHDALFAQQIMHEYGNQFSSIFSYVKNGTRHVKTKPCHIIKQYRRMKGLINEDDNDEDN